MAALLATLCFGVMLLMMLLAIESEDGKGPKVLPSVLAKWCFGVPPCEELSHEGNFFLFGKTRIRCALSDSSFFDYRLSALAGFSVREAMPD